MAQAEEWRPVVGYEGLYSVSSLGRVRSEERYVPFNTRWGKVTTKHVPSRTLAPDYTHQGYPQVQLSKEDSQQKYRVHLLVLTAFKGPRPSGNVGCHNNGNQRDARADNLRWDTPSANCADRKLHGTAHLGESHPAAKLTEEDVMAIRRSPLSAYRLARVYGISNSHAQRIRSGERWGHLCPP